MSFKNLVLLFWLTLFFCCSIYSVEASSKKNPGANYVVVPVYYLTDRNKEGQSFGAQRKYTINCQHHMYYGITHVPVPNEQFKTQSPLFDKLNWKEADKTAPVALKDEIKADNIAIEKKLFFESLSKALEQSGSNRLCIFLHGGADPFEDSTLDAALMGYYLECPVVIYSWPSVGKLNKYRVDEGNVEWSQQHFNTFLSDLETFAGEHPCQISIVAHSMGNRLIARAAGVLRAGGGIVHDIALVSPDIDSETFEHYVMGYNSRAAKVRLYVSNRDKVLPFTQMLYGGYYRLGEGVGAVLSTLNPSQKTSSPVTSSPAPIRQNILKTDDFSLAQVSSEPKLEKIDFTAIDHGVIGHNLPFSLVANMSRYDRPGDGFSLVSSTEEQGNKFARYERWRNKLDGTAPLGLPGICKRVVPDAFLLGKQAVPEGQKAKNSKLKTAD